MFKSLLLESKYLGKYVLDSVLKSNHGPHGAGSIQSWQQIFIELSTRYWYFKGEKKDYETLHHNSRELLELGNM